MRTLMPAQPQRRWSRVLGGASVALGLTLLLAACGGGGSSSTTGGSSSAQDCHIVKSGTPVSVAGTPVTINGESSLHLIKGGTLTIASDTTYTPAEFEDPQHPGTYIGYDIDLVKEIANRLCLQPKVVKADFDKIIPDLSGPPLGQQIYDISISSFTIKADRLAKVNMIPYFQAGESILVAKGNPKGVHSISDMCGKVVAVQDGTVEQDELNDANGKGDGSSGQDPVCKSNNIRLFHNADQNLVALQVVNNTADASYQDEPVTNYYVKQNTGKLESGGRTVAPLPQGIVVRKDNQTLEAAVRAALREMDHDGTYNKILGQWGVQSNKYTQGQ